MLIFMLSFVACMGIFSFLTGGFKGTGSSSATQGAFQEILALPVPEPVLYPDYTTKNIHHVLGPLLDAVDTSPELTGEVTKIDEKALAEGDADALYEHARKLIQHAQNREQMTEGFAEMEKAYAKGHPLAGVYIGVSALYGNGLDKNPAKAEKYLREAAASSPDVALYLAVHYLSGEHLPKNVPAAVSLIDSAAAAGSADALFAKGLVLAFVSGDNPGAISAFKGAAVQQLDAAQYYLGMMAATGRGMRKNPADAFEWTAFAAESGLAEAQYTMGVMALTGFGSQPDRKWAMMWFDRAARAGVADAQFMLGRAYLDGRETDKDPKTAAKLFYSAAKQLHPYAMLYLGAMYASGIGVKEDGARALFWLQKAKNAGLNQADSWIGKLTAPKDVPGGSLFSGKTGQ